MLTEAAMENDIDISELKTPADYFEEFNEDLTEFAKFMSEMCEKLYNFAVDLLTNKRVRHLSRHGKGRTKKKNIHRIQKEFVRMQKRMDKIISKVREKKEKEYGQHI